MVKRKAMPLESGFENVLPSPAPLYTFYFIQGKISLPLCAEEREIGKIESLKVKTAGQMLLGGRGRTAEATGEC